MKTTCPMCERDDIDIHDAQYDARRGKVVGLLATHVARPHREDDVECEGSRVHVAVTPEE